MLVLLLVAFAAAPARAASPAARPALNAFQLKLGGFVPRGGGDFWEENRGLFALEASDLGGPAWGLAYVRSLNNRFEAGFGLDVYSSHTSVSYDGFIASDGFPIAHDTRLTVTPLTMDLRLIPAGRYASSRHGSNGRPVFYLGAGAGFNLWEYRESGEFIDFGDPGLPVFYGDFREEGAALEAHALAGLEFPVTPNLNLMFEGRYSWSTDTLSDDFGGLGEIDLSGPWVQAAVSFRW
jgi:opacity protein-like surface antigen